MKFKIVLKKSEDGFFTAIVPALPGCISQGRTEAEAERNIREAIELHISSLAADGVAILEKDAIQRFLNSNNIIISELIKWN